MARCAAALEGVVALMLKSVLYLFGGFCLLLYFLQVLFESPRFETVIGGNENFCFFVMWLCISYCCCLVALVYAARVWYLHRVCYSHSIAGGECRIPWGSVPVLSFPFVLSRA